MRKMGLMGMVALLTMAAPGAARAGLVLGVGTGLAKPLGSIQAGDGMAEAVSWMVPLELQVGWKLLDRLTLTATGAIDFGIVGGDFRTRCDASGDDCLVNQTRMGGQVRWNFHPTRRLDPWVGAGLVWEVIGIERTSATSGVNTNSHGLALDVMAGADYWVGRRFAISPWLGVGVGRYTEAKLVSAFDADWEPIGSRRFHALVTAGVRLAWELGGTKGDRRGEQGEPPPAP